jgi:hypothetical protein
MEFVTINTALYVSSGNSKTEAIEIDSNLISIQIIGSNIDIPNVLLSVYGGHTTDVSKMGNLLKANELTNITYDIGNGNYIYTIDSAFPRYISFGIDIVGATTGSLIILVSYKRGIHSLPKTFSYLTAEHNDLIGLNVGNYMHLTAAEYATFVSSPPHSHSNKIILDGTEESFTTALKNAYDSAVTWISTNGTNLINHLTNISNPHSVTASQVGAYTSGQTDTLLDTKQDFIDTKRDIDLYWSAGSISGFGITNNGDGTVDIDAGVTILRNSASETAPLSKYAIAQTLAITLTDDSINYIYADYNSGSPILSVTTSINDFNCLDKCIIYTIARWGINLEILFTGHQSIDTNGKIRRKIFERQIFERTRGLVLGNSLLNVTTTSGDIWFGLEKHSISAFDTSATDTFTYFYDSGGWVRTGSQTDIDEVNIVSGAMTNNNRYKVEYVYIIPDTPDKLYVSLATTQYSSLADANLDTPPISLPPELEGMGILIGRFIIRKNNGIIEIQSAFNLNFNPTLVTNHNDLANLQGGTTDEYYHLTSAQHTELTSAEFTRVFNFLDIEQAVYKLGVSDFKIMTVTNPDSIPNITIEVNGSPYTLTDPIDQYDEVTIDVDALGLVVLNCEYL